MIAVDSGCDPVAPALQTALRLCQLQTQGDTIAQETGLASVLCPYAVKQSHGHKVSLASCFFFENNSHGAIWLQMKQGKLVLVLL